MTLLDCYPIRYDDGTWGIIGPGDNKELLRLCVAKNGVDVPLEFSTEEKAQQFLTVQRITRAQVEQ